MRRKEVSRRRVEETHLDSLKAQSGAGVLRGRVDMPVDKGVPLRRVVTDMRQQLSGPWQ